jgi:hypothetical protein
MYTTVKSSLNPTFKFRYDRQYSLHRTQPPPPLTLFLTLALFRTSSVGHVGDEAMWRGLAVLRA